MTDVVDLLEKMGEAACFDSRVDEVIAQEIECAEESALVISAVLAGDAKVLRSTLGLGPMVSLVMPAEEEEEDDEEKEGIPPAQDPSSSLLEVGVR